jgi:carbamoyl-phosphate synthase small subunit
MSQTSILDIIKPKKPTAIIVLDDGSHYYGYGFGAAVEHVGEICFNTGLSGYQETLTDPSYAGQIITFTFPHIGNVGTNDEDMEASKPHCKGMIIRQDITESSNWRAISSLHEWLVQNNLPAISGVDTRALTRRIRDKGAPKGVIAHAPTGNFNIDQLTEKAKKWGGLEGLDLAKDVTCSAPYEWDHGLWQQENQSKAASRHIVAIDYGAKHNILRCLKNTGAKVTVVPAQTSAQDIMALKPDGVFLSNGPGDPAATGAYAIPVIQDLLANDLPIFGICLGHQLLSLAIGGKTEKMHLGHRGANHPVQDLATGKVEITSQNHGFCVLGDSLPSNATITHKSLFDGSNEGIALTDKLAFSVQYHPEASPGPMDSHYLFHRFIEMIDSKTQLAA